jgi:hypothetical protein
MEGDGMREEAPGWHYQRQFRRMIRLDRYEFIVAAAVAVLCTAGKAIVVSQSSGSGHVVGLR